ncbi:GNAT family N-acetyltransferase [Fructilactobacillus fructivorans]|uniref:Spermidine acetyltransferase n=1 Tax=Fructilactobacillus fructivorans TaxID=1614 RepID=A0A0C1M033_9LACO|nr:GNAT family N-acetyltransferase [Fructilactobacillus fructivorans]KID42480.1 spermidine acetyltransferase [Fructilactobacillus fructivorans]MCT0151599.1 GNAT family N-acetyltransferase [Fructilactobacillus fructivorans]MCT2868091.1 GNAT family N-acetyltransferase [Fructilactobacillus fructivorans]MCT2868588.1 GNAT family N-acetyltransferase [Fructilactobacillus fructivorans]MCT2873786.1 GNAT family N-acetyltransferase [Fructilactobacillus fructivorans]
MKLRALEKTDLPKLHELFNDKPTMDYWFAEPYESMMSLEARYERENNDPTIRNFAIDVNGKFAGIVALIDINSRDRNAEIEIALSDEFVGNGIAQEAFDACVKYGFETLNLHKIFLYVDVENKPAVHIYEKFGFKIEGTLKGQFYVNGKYRDVYWMAKFENA